LSSATALVSADEPSLPVYYAGPEGTVKTALELAEVTLVSSLTEADVFVLNGVIPNPTEVAAYVENGAGIVLILGPEVSAQQLEPLLGEVGDLQVRSQAVSLKVNEANADGISPLHGRFPIAIYDQARAEAEALTEERVALI
jgi:hypothetical protein